MECLSDKNTPLVHLQCTLYLPMYFLFDLSLVVFTVVSINMSKPGYMYQMLHSFLFNTVVHFIELINCCQKITMDQPSN